MDPAPTHFPFAYGLALLAQGLVRHGDQAAALAALREGLASADVTGEHFWDRNYTALPGPCCSPKTNSTRAQASLQHAIHIAQAQRAKSLELRATTSLAQVLR